MHCMMRDKNLFNISLPKLVKSGNQAKLKCFVEKMKMSGAAVIDIAESLRNADCSLASIVSFQDTQLTQAFLQQSTLNPIDSFQSVHNAMFTFKLQQVQTLLTHGPLFKKRRMYFLRCMLKMVAKSRFENSTAVKVFARQILHWNILSKNEVAVIERILKKASEENLRILLQSGIIRHAKKNGNRDVFVHVFGNANAIDLMKDVKFDVNARGFNGQTALHVAVQNKLPKNVEFLLKRGANPDAKDDGGETPIFEALWSINNPNAGAKCVELLFLNGADVQACDFGGVSFVYHAARMNVILNLLELTLTHLTVREAMGLSIEQLILDQIGVREGSRIMLESCRKKIEEMKMKEVCDGVTMFEMITGRVLRRMNAKDCQDVGEFLGRQEGSNGYYDNILKYRIDRIVEISKLKCKLRVILYGSIEALRSYDLVIDKIISFFSYKDLIVLE